MLFRQKFGVWKLSDSFERVQTRLYSLHSPYTSSPTVYIDKQRFLINQNVQSSKVLVFPKGCYETHGQTRGISSGSRVYRTLELFVYVFELLQQSLVNVQTWSASKIECCLAFGQLLDWLSRTFCSQGAKSNFQIFACKRFLVAV